MERDALCASTNVKKETWSRRAHSEIKRVWERERDNSTPTRPFFHCTITYIHISLYIIYFVYDENVYTYMFFTRDTRHIARNTIYRVAKTQSILLHNDPAHVFSSSYVRAKTYVCDGMCTHSLNAFLCHHTHSAASCRSIQLSSNWISRNPNLGSAREIYLNG